MQDEIAQQPPAHVLITCGEFANGEAGRLTSETIMTLTDILAIVGTGTGCSALCLQRLSHLMDRSRLRVEVDLAVA